MCNENNISGFKIIQYDSRIVVLVGESGDVEIPCVKNYKLITSSDGTAELILNIEIKNCTLGEFIVGKANLKE